MKEFHFERPDALEVDFATFVMLKADVGSIFCSLVLKSLQEFFRSV